MENEESDAQFLLDLKRGLIEGDLKNEKQEENEEKTEKPKNLLGFVSEFEIEETEQKKEQMSQKSNESDTEEKGYFSKTAKLKSKKEIKKIDVKSKIYNPIRKDLYVECAEISVMTEAEVDEVRKNLGDIKVRGQELIRPIFSWHHCGLNKKILDLIELKLNFKNPFPIQCQAIPVIMSGRDMIGIAETGSGKTLAYVLPMLRHVKDQSLLQPGDGPIGLIMVPTRELASQVYSTVKLFSKMLDFNVAAVYGGRGIGSQISDIKKGCEIVVCTPGRMIELLACSTNRSINLDRCTFVVIDEADRMFDFGFEPQLTKILSIIRPTRQTVMFSATFPNNVAVLARRVLSKPIEIVVGTRGQICRNVEQSIEIVDEEFKIFRLLELLGVWLEKGSIIIFVDKQEQGDELYTKLVKYRYSPLLVHGAQSQEDRESAMIEFRNSNCKLLIATSLVARGLDVQNIILVVNYYAPTHKEEYIHRIGILKR